MTKLDTIMTDTKLGSLLREMIEDARHDYDTAPDRASQLQALARLARLRASLAGLEAG